MKNKHSRSLRQVLAKLGEDIELLDLVHSHTPHIVEEIKGFPSKRTLLSLNKKIDTTFDRIETRQQEITQLEDKLLMYLLEKEESIKDAKRILKTVVKNKYPEDLEKLGL